MAERDNITDAEFEVVKGPYQPVYRDPELELRGWRRWFVEGIGLTIFAGGFVVLLVFATWFGDAFADWWDGLAKAAAQALTG